MTRFSPASRMASGLPSGAAGGWSAGRGSACPDARRPPPRPLPYAPASGAVPASSAALPGPHADRAAEAHGAVHPGTKAAGPLVFAAERTAPGHTAHHFTGKIEAPRLRSGALAARWDFAAGIGT